MILWYNAIIVPDACSSECDSAANTEPNSRELTPSTQLDSIGLSLDYQTGRKTGPGA